MKRQHNSSFVVLGCLCWLALAGCDRTPNKDTMPPGLRDSVPLHSPDAGVQSSDTDASK